MIIIVLSIRMRRYIPTPVPTQALMIGPEKGRYLPVVAGFRVGSKETGPLQMCKSKKTNSRCVKTKKGSVYDHKCTYYPTKYIGSINSFKCRSAFGVPLKLTKKSRQLSEKAVKQLVKAIEEFSKDSSMSL